MLVVFASGLCGMTAISGLLLQRGEDERGWRNVCVGGSEVGTP